MKKRIYHGLSNSEERPIYDAWRNMMCRCHNPNHSRFKDWGGRGIVVCEEWHDVKTFVEWAIANNYSQGLTIDRKDNNGNYEPSNCRWTTRKEQGNNRRDNKLATFNGQTKTVTEWSNVYGIDRATIYYRIKAGWPIDRALNTPSQRQKQ